MFNLLKHRVYSASGKINKIVTLAELFQYKAKLNNVKRV